MIILVEIGNQRTELVDKTIDLIARKFSEILKLPAASCRESSTVRNFTISRFAR